LRKTRAPATKPTRREPAMSRSVIMVLFGNEFDADERAEVGGGDGLGETEDCHVTSDLRHVVLTTRE
jgi:hypothetical protein